MKDFIKLYNTEEYGQVAAIMDSDDEGAPMLRFMCTYENDADNALITHGVVFNDNSEGWDIMNDMFLDFDEEVAIDLAKSIIKSYVKRMEEKKSEVIH